MSQPRHVLQALVDIPTTFDYLTFKRPFNTTVMVKYKNNKNIINFNNVLKMSRQLPVPRGPSQTGTGQRREQRRPPGPNLHGESMYPQQFAPRIDYDLAIRGENRPPFYQFKGSQDNNRRPKYGRRSLSPRIDQYRPSYSDPYRDHPERFVPESDSRDFNERSPQTNHDSSTDYRQGQRKPNNKYPTAPRRSERERKSSKKVLNRPSRGNWSYTRVASEREFLRTNRAPTPQLMLGMNLEADSAAKFLPIEDLSDSEEADMDLSGDDNNGTENKELRAIASSDGDSSRFCLNSDSHTLTTQDEVIKSKILCVENTSPNSKSVGKRRLHQEAAKKECDSTPRWSNPDPYTALPPPDESQKKKKDVVKLIRKARIASEKKKDPEASTDDFISLNIEEKSAVSPTAPQAKNNPNKVRHKIINNSENLPKSERAQDSKPVSKNIRSPASPRNKNSDNHKQSEKKGTRSKSSKKTFASDLTSDPNLGSRKRTARDEIKQPPLIYEKGVRPPPDGRILKDWLPYDEHSQTPWLIDHSSTKNMHHRLHMEILDFYHFVKPKWFEQSIRENLIYDLRRRVRNFYTGVDIVSFGSFPAGLYLPTADLDLVMISDNYVQGGRPQYGYSPKQVRRFARFLEQERIVLRGSQECILKAKVPLVKYVDNLTGLRVDISFENTTGLVANKTFQNWKDTFPAMPILVTLIKQFLSMRGLNEPVNGGIGGFSVTCLVVSLLQHMPQVQEKTMIPEEHLGEVLMEFFDLYGNKFNTADTAISLNPARYIRKSELDQTYRKQVDKFSIIDPNNPKNDIAGGSRNSGAIKRAFKNAHGNLQRRMDELQNNSLISNRQPQSILSCILGGNYNSFKLQRDHLAHIYENKIGPLK
ncbi:putative topoisomerase family protein [Golovinomyces cichoracearum]|uniref:polynucleotide adenylyltransferase n=1 Tax=Golovinomyces cichoracearum TaxID=62708 RepID=A0A420IDW9_9PEZI|nr:putative topoisomerase family protein [Golovinomyces cichoracearum]